MAGFLASNFDHLIHIGTAVIIAAAYIVAWTFRRKLNKIGMTVDSIQVQTDSHPTLVAKIETLEADMRQLKAAKCQTKP